MEAPKCHYHSNNKITYFCLNECTLPLCDSCLIQHRKKDLSGECMKRIVEYSKARQFALEVLQTEKEMVITNVEQFDKKYCQFKNEVITSVGNALNALYPKIKQGICHFDSSLSNIQGRIQNVKTNQIKELIILYMNILKEEAEPQWDFRFFVNGEKILEQLQNFTQIRKQQKQVFDEMKKKQNKVIKLPSAQNIEEKIKEIQAAIFKLAMKSENQSPYLQMSDQKNVVNRSMEGGRSERKGPRPGIFVSMSPKKRANLSSYSSQSKEIGSYQQDKIHQHLPLTQSQIFKTTNPNEYQNRKQNEENVFHSRGRSQVMTRSVKKGDEWQFPEKVTIYKFSNSKNRLELKTPTASERSHKKQLRNVINRTSMHSNSSSSRLIISKDDCMNPQAMRQLILKKRNAKVPTQPQEQKIFMGKLSGYPKGPVWG